MNLVDSSVTKATDVLDVERFTPTTRFTKYTLAKNNIKDMLMPYYRVESPHAHWAYTNYNTANFFTAWNESGQHLVPTSSVLLYPNSNTVPALNKSGYASGSYMLSGAFSFDFHINPRYNEDGIDSNHFKAGTILHLSSTYAVSLITGSNRDYEGRPSSFKLQLQLSHSADIEPSKAKTGQTYPNDLVFVSDDVLAYSNWHHVVIRWGTNDINDGTGSFIIDGVNRGNFVIPSSSIAPRPGSSLNPDVLCVGNYYEGSNYGTAAQSMFFATQPARRDGVDQLTNDTIQNEPDSYRFRHPLKAEIHDLIIRREYMTDSQVSDSMTFGPSTDDIFNNRKTAFYLPPYFVEATPIRRYVGDHGGILQTPFFEIDGTTDDPFNVALAFGVNGHYINLENFTKDFAQGRFPRLLNLTASALESRRT
jgi:hypothetical protein